MSNKKREAAGVEVIAERDAHACLLGAIPADGYACEKSDVGEMALPVVSVKEVGRGIVGDKKVEAAIVVEVGPDGSEAVVAMGIVDPGGFGDFGESAVAVVVKQQVASAFQAARPALHGEAVILAGFAGTKFGEIVEMEVYVMGDKEVGKAVGVVIAESGAGGELCVDEAG